MKIVKLSLVGILSLGTIFGVTNATEAAVAGELESDANVIFEENNDITPPTDPDNPDPENPIGPEVDPEVPGQEIKPGTPGPLSIDHASHFNFGKVKKSGNEETYFAKAITFKNSDDTDGKNAPFIQVTDNRGSEAGWQVQVAQEGQLKNTDTDLELDGAQIKVSNGIVNSLADTAGVTSAADTIVLDPEGNPHVVLTAEAGHGAGTFTNKFGELDGDVTKDVSLTVPRGSRIDDGHYQTSLKWTLYDTPDSK